MANPSIYAAFERMWQHIVAKLGTKVDKENGKGLSANDYTDEDKNKLSSVSDLVGTTSVSEQINTALENFNINLDEINGGTW
jgi:hypothetical protein